MRREPDGAGHRRIAVALRHVALEDLGPIARILEEFGWTASYCHASTEDLDDPLIVSADLLIVLGGPVGAHDTPAFPFLSKEIAPEYSQARAKKTAAARHAY